MAKKNRQQADAKRAAKKHAKHVKRKKLKRTAAATPLVVPFSFPWDGWRPGEEGIEGLAERMEVSHQTAAHYAEDLHADGRIDAVLAWLPSRVRALTDEELLQRLAQLGVVTGPEALEALTAEHASGRSIARLVWQPLCPSPLSVHDRDYMSQAAVELWERWVRHVLSDEAIAVRLDAITETLERARPETALVALLDLWDDVRMSGGGARLEAAELGSLFTDSLGYALEAPWALGEEVLTRAGAAVAELIASPTHSEDVSVFESMQADIAWGLSGPEGPITLSAEPSAHTLLALAELATLDPSATSSRIAEVQGALDAAIPTAAGGHSAALDAASRALDPVHAAALLREPDGDARPRPRRKGW